MATGRADLTGATDYDVVANEGFSTTLSSNLSAAATTIVPAATTGYSDGDWVVWYIDAGEATEEVVYGEINSGQLTNVVRGVIGSAQSHTSGATIVDYPSPAHIEAIKKRLDAEHNPNGTHSDITASSVTSSGDINTTSRGALKDNSVALSTMRSETFADFVASGGVVAQVSGLTGSFSDIVYYINGERYSVTGVANKTYTASKDTYVDIGIDGVVDYTEVANGAAAPALAADHKRIATVVTGASAITSINQNKFDNNGVPIRSTYPITPSQIVNPYKFSAFASTTQSSIPDNALTKVNMTGLHYDTAGGYNTSLSRYTVQKSGYYRFSCYMVVSAVLNNLVSAGGYFYVNGTRTRDFGGQYPKHGAGEQNNDKFSGDCLIYLNQGDYVEIYVGADVISSTSSIGGDASGRTTRWEGFLVSEI